MRSKGWRVSYVLLFGNRVGRIIEKKNSKSHKHVDTQKPNFLITKIGESWRRKSSIDPVFPLFTGKGETKFSFLVSSLLFIFFFLSTIHDN